MHLLLLIFLAFAQVLTSNAQCIILPITPTVFNGLHSCGYGGLIADCQCCGDQRTACLNPIQECAPGLGDNFVCVNNPQYTSTCASEGFDDCGSGCMPSSATCCPGQTGWCPAGYSCGATSNCIPDDSSGPSSASSSAATVPPLSFPTAKTIATTPTPTVSFLSSSPSKTTAITSTSASHTQSSPNTAPRKRCGGISSLITIVAMNVFIFCWL